MELFLSNKIGFLFNVTWNILMYSFQGLKLDFKNKDSKIILRQGYHLTDSTHFFCGPKPADACAWFGLSLNHKRWF